MKARKRVVTSGAGKAAGKRTPTVRRIRPAIVPAPRPTGAAAGRLPALPRSGGEARASDEVAAALDLAVDLGRGLVLRNPIVAASGAFGFGVEHGDAVALDQLGGVCTRGVTLATRNGNAGPRMTRIPGGLLNGIGLQNPGIAAVLERYGRAWRTFPTALLVNVCGATTADYVAVARHLDEAPGVGGIELNLGCPSATRGGLLFSLDPDAAGSVTAAVRRATDLPLLVKLSPAAADPRAVARAVEDAGADALTAINTLPGLAVARGRRRPLLGSAYGGISGAAIRPVAQRVVFEVAGAVTIPVLAAGGVTTLDDVLDFLALGAAAVQVGTAALGDPQLPQRLAGELAEECRRRGLDSHRSLVGTALPQRTVPTSSRGAEYRP